MKTKRFLTSALVGGCLLGTVLTVGAGVADAAGKPRIQRTERPRVERRDDRREVQRHRRHAVVRERPRVVVRRHRRPALRRVHTVRVVHSRPWYAGVRTVVVDRNPFYFNAGLGLYFGGVNLNIELGDCPPVGYAYFDPYCGEEFYSVVDYQRHLRFHHHTAALRVVWIGD